MRDADEESAAGLSWSDSLDAIDWIEVETLYRLAPLGNKSATHLAIFEDQAAAFERGYLGST